MYQLHIIKRLALLSLFVCLLSARPSGAQELKDLGSGELLALASLQQQLADIDTWKCQQFKREAWTRVGTGLQQFLTTAAAKGENSFREEVSRLVKGRFRDCLDQADVDQHKAELARLTDLAKPLDKTKPITLRADVFECFLVLDAARPPLEEMAAKWKREQWLAGASPKIDGKTIIESALLTFERRQRLEAKTRLLSTQPTWVLDAFGSDVRNLVKQAADELEKTGRLTKGTEWKDKKAMEERAVADGVTPESWISLEASLQAVSQATTEWFEKNSVTLLKLRTQLEQQLKIVTVDFPPDWEKSNSCFIRATLQPQAGKLTEARLFFCRPDTRIKAAIVESNQLKPVDSTPIVQDGKPAQLIEQIDLGITLTRTILKDGQLVLVQAGAGAERRDDPVRIAAAAYALGVPKQFRVAETKVIRIASDLKEVVLAIHLQLPGLPVRIPVEVTLSPEKVNASVPLNTILIPLLSGMRNSAIESLNALGPIGFDTPAGKVRLSKWQASGEWANGEIVLSAEVTMADLGSWRVPLEVVSGGGQGWSVRLAAHAIPGKVFDELRKKLQDKLTENLDTSVLAPEVQNRVSKLPNFLKAFRDRIGIENVLFDPVSGKVKGEVVWLAQPAGITIPRVPFQAALSGSISVNTEALQNALKTHLLALVNSILNDLVGNLSRDAISKLRGTKIEILTATLEVTNVGEYDSSRGGVPVEATVSIDGEKMTIRDLWFLGLKLPITPQLEGLHVDFSEAKTTPSLEKFLARLFGHFVKIPESAIQISGVRFARDGICACVTLKIDALGDPLTLGEVCFGMGGVKARPDLDGLMKNLQKLVSQRLAAEFSGRVTLPDLGPVKKLALDDASTFSIDDGLRLYIKGEIVTPILESVPIPFSLVQVFPQIDLSKIKIDPPPVNILKGALDGLFQFGDENSPVILKITDPKVKLARPFGISFNVVLKALVFQIDVDGVALTQRGLDVPDRLAARFPGYFPVGPLALVNPGVGIYLSNASKLDILGDLTFVAPGVDKIIAVRGSLTADVKSWSFDLQGRLVLLSALPIFEVKGELRLKEGTAQLNARTLPPIDKFVSLTGQVQLDGPGLCARTSTDLSILGLRLFTLNLTIKGRPKADEAVLHFEGQINLLLGGGAIVVDLDPDLARCKAKAKVNFGVGGFDIAAAELSISPSLTRLQFRILGFKITINVATISCLTPKLILDVILSLFDFDPVGFFRALSRGEVVVNLVDNKGNAVDNLGEGDPLPGGGPTTGQTKPPGGQQPVPESAQKDKPAGAPASEYRESRTEAGERPAPPGDKPKDNRPLEVYTYQPGTARIEFVEDPKDRSRVVEVTTSLDGKQRWEGHFSVEPAVANALKAPGAMIVTSLWLKFPAGQRITCRNGFVHDGGEGYLVLQKDGLFVAGMFPGGKYDRVDVDLAQIGKKLTPTAAWDTIVAGQRPFLTGDLTVLGDLARAKVAGQTTIKEFRRVAGLSGKPEDDGYIYSMQERPDGRDALAVYQARNGGRVTVEVASPMYPVVVDPDSTLAGPICEYLADATVGNRALTLLAVESGEQPSSHDPLGKANVDPLYPTGRPGVKRLFLIRQDSKGKVWLDGLQAKPLLIRSALLTAGAPPVGGLSRGIWNSSSGQTEPFVKAIGDSLMALEKDSAENEVRFGPRGGPIRTMAFARRLNAANWTAQVVMETPPTPANKDVKGVIVSSVLPGDALSKRYLEWKDKSGNVSSQGRERFKDLSGESERQALLDVLIGPRTDWPKYFNSNPLGLLIP